MDHPTPKLEQHSLLNDQSKQQNSHLRPHSQPHPQQIDQNKYNHLGSTFQGSSKYILNHINSIEFSNSCINIENGIIYNILQRVNDKKTIKCKCVKSFCKAKYCECFRNGKICGVDCQCRECKNNQTNQIANKNKIKSKSKDSSPTFITSSLDGHLQKIPNSGCKCKKSNCIKKYCECFQNGRKCGGLCSCLNCLNKLQQYENKSSQVNDHNSREQNKNINRQSKNVKKLVSKDSSKHSRAIVELSDQDQDSIIDRVQKIQQIAIKKQHMFKNNQKYKKQQEQQEQQVECWLQQQQQIFPDIQNNADLKQISIIKKTKRILKTQSTRKTKDIK